MPFQAPRVKTSNPRSPAENGRPSQDTVIARSDALAIVCSPAKIPGYRDP